jgi:hypothetical protein
LLKSIVASATCLPSAVFSWVVSCCALDPDEVVVLDEVPEGWFEQPLNATTGMSGTTSQALRFNMRG